MGKILFKKKQTFSFELNILRVSVEEFWKDGLISTLIESVKASGILLFYCIFRISLSKL